MRFALLRRAAFAAAVGALALPASAFGVAQIHGNNEGLADYDVRVGAVAPTSAQKAAVRRLHAKVSWNRFGTPASLSKRGRFLAKGIRGKNAVEAAQRWLYRNRVLFGLKGVDNMILVGDTRLPFSRAHAVTFRQVIEGVATADGGEVTIGIRGSAKKRWSVAYASSALTRNVSLAGRARLSPEQAWVKAANLVGESYSVVDVREKKFARGWTNIAVAGMRDLQATKLVAFPTIRAGVAPAFESIVLKAKDAVAYRVIVDARTGALLSRANLVENAAAGTQAIQTFNFDGEMPATDAACGPMHGPYPVVAGSGVRVIDVFANATVQSNDIVLKLFRDGTLITSADTLFSPEAIHYEPGGEVPAGNYTVQVCDFPDGAVWTAPRTYFGTVTLDDSPAPDPALARWKTFPANPPLHVLPSDPWGNPSTDTREVWCWQAASGCDKVIGNLASRGPWDHNHKLNAPTFTTQGNNAKAATSWNDPFLPGTPQFHPTAANRNYSFPWTNNWFNTDCAPTPGAPGSTWDDAAATVNLFVTHNRMHDWAYFLGFTEQNFNAQDYNFGLTPKFRENDPILGDVQAGANAGQFGQRNNANMITLPDGFASVTNMYFWQPVAAGFYAPCVDGDYDMSIIGHEYGHMIENRMIGKGNARTGFHAGAMGESFGDLNAAEYLSENGFVPTSDENEFSVGPYATGNKLNGIRDYALDYPMSGAEPQPGMQLKINALNFSNMGFDTPGPEVHSDGEIWNATNFRIRQLLMDKYDDDFPADDSDLQESCANGELPPQNCPGNRRWFQLYYDAMLLMPVDTSMLQGRDAILSADVLRFGGANQKEIWLAFARSGYGFGATSSNTNANTDTDPTPSFASPLHDNAVVDFRAENRDGTALTNARFFVGHYEARTSPIADSDPATTGANLDDVAEFAPGRYEVLGMAPGYGLLRGRVNLRKGEHATMEFRFATNYASANGGAVATGDTSGANPAAQAANLRNLIDDTENTVWTTAATLVGGPPGNIVVDGKKVTIDLVGSDPVRIRSVQVSTLLGPGQNRFTALRQFQIQTCNAARADCTTDAGYSTVFTSGSSAFPGDVPRPTAPQMILREFNVSDSNATHLRFVVKSTQCTGAPQYQGEQDADPRRTTDCDSNVPAGEPRSFARATEVQAFKREGSVQLVH
jgi:extracellular elastinolytic metalloproteinase